MGEEYCLNDLKEDYEKIRKKHNLPSFEQLNEDFQIEKVAECETDYLIREVRKYISDKFANYLRFIESLLNPVNVPLFVYSIIKHLSKEDNEKLKEIYQKIAKREVYIIEVDIEYNEKKEAEFIQESFKFWQEIKKEILEIIDKIKENWDNKSEKNNKGYYG